VAVRYRMLGPLEVVDDHGRAVPLKGRRQFDLLAAFLIEPNQVFPAGQLVDVLWPLDPPPTARQQLHNTVHRLRQLIGAQLVTAGQGYRLIVAPDERDVDVFEALAADARDDVAAGELERAAARLHEALELWRGQPLDGVTTPAAGVESARLAERRLAVLEERIAVDFRLGRHAELVPELFALVAAHPLHERLRGQLMTALYGSGRQADALAVYRAGRQQMVDELGIEPGPALRQIQQAILRRELPVRPPRKNADSAADSAADRAAAALAMTEPPRPPRQLPPEPAVFVGREAQLAAALAALEPNGMVAFHGLGGVGKSCLALRAAHAVADRFPDGQLYIDLQGATPGRSPVPPAEALGRFLRALGVPHGELPAAPAEAAARFQSVLADRRVLILLDNAADVTQVVPLLPASAGCAVLITSRAMLATLDACPVAVGTFDRDESVHLLELLTGADRVAAEPEAAAVIAERCDHHALALRIAGARLKARPDWSLARFGQRLADQRRRLDELRVADLAIRSCFTVSYGALADAAAVRAFRLLGALDVPETGVALTAVLLDTDTTVAERALDHLVEARLLEPLAEGRFRMHDLLRLFAAELGQAHERPDELQCAGRRVLQWYVERCRQIDVVLRPHTSTGGEAVLPQLGEAVRWFDTRLPALLAAAGWAARQGPDIAGFVTTLLPLIKSLATKRGFWRELEVIARLALDVAGRDGDREAEAAALAVIGLVEWRAGRVDAARSSMLRGLELRRELGDREGEGLSLHNLGWLRLRTGDPEEALRYITEGLALLDAHGHPVRAAQARHNLGDVLLQLGRHEEASTCLQQALAVRRAHRDVLGVSVTLVALGRALCLAGRPEEALRTVEEALVCCAETGNRDDAWEALLTRSELHLRGGDPAASRADAIRASELAAQVGDAYGEAAAMRQRARARAALGEAAGAEADARRAEELFAASSMPRDAVFERLLGKIDHGVDATAGRY
jgi:DNA-binding SARP family transcriptional activator/tetratricopeptide (TPR) repeat protein